jgi:hypothetical protein
VPTFEIVAPEPVVEEVDFSAVVEEPPAEPAPAEMELLVPPAVEEVAEPEAVQASPEWARAPEAEYIEDFSAKESVEVVPESEQAVVEKPVAEEPIAIEEPVDAAPAPVVEQEPVVEEIAAAPEKDVLADFVLDLEDALPAEFGTAPPPRAPAMASAAVAGASAPTPPPIPEIAAVASIPAPLAAAAPITVAVQEAMPAPVLPAEAATDLSSLAAEESSSVLSDLFAEFKEEVGEAQEEAEDPETHYNLGVAFKEMGLLDEAIGELQKVCKSIERGTPFTQVMQAYTWLAGCFVEKGVPEASIKWYSKALTVATNDESRTALHYDLASAHEASGERQLALKHFMEVYGTNIDYRDVAERIKALRA